MTVGETPGPVELESEYDWVYPHSKSTWDWGTYSYEQSQFVILSLPLSEQFLSSGLVGSEHRAGITEPVSSTAFKLCIEEKMAW